MGSIDRQVSGTFRASGGTKRAISRVGVISRKRQALPGLERKVIAVFPYALRTLVASFRAYKNRIITVNYSVSFINRKGDILYRI